MIETIIAKHLRSKGSTNNRNIIRHALADPSSINFSFLPTYRLALVENTTDIPFIVTSSMMYFCNNISLELKDDEQRAKYLFEWLQQTIPYGKEKTEYNYHASNEVLSNGKGICGELSYLYVTLARLSNLQSAYARVIIDVHNKDVHHACASVVLKRGCIFVDPAYHTYDIHHKKVEVISDRQACDLFSKWRHS